MRTTAFVLAVSLLVSCRQAEMVPTEPSPATEAEMAAFCTTWNEVRNLSFSEGLARLLDVAPEEIRGQIARQVGLDPTTWSEDLEAIDNYTAQCDARS